MTCKSWLIRPFSDAQLSQLLLHQLNSVQSQMWHSVAFGENHFVKDISLWKSNYTLLISTFGEALSIEDSRGEQCFNNLELEEQWGFSIVWTVALCCNHGCPIQVQTDSPLQYFEVFRRVYRITLGRLNCFSNQYTRVEFFHQSNFF